MEEMIIHRGGQLVSKADLDLIKLPQPTDSYVPVSHFALAERILTISQDLLTDFVLQGENYAIARQGQQLFALLKFRKDNSEIGLSVAFRNSYDRSMSVGIAVGASVFVCDNLALHGDIAVMKKHTKNVWETLEDVTISTLYKSQHKYEEVIADAGRLKGLPMANKEAFELMGYLYGNDILSPRQLTVVKEEWLRPTHPEFRERSKWSFFNAVTESLKTCPPTIIMEKHGEAYQAIVEG